MENKIHKLLLKMSFYFISLWLLFILATIGTFSYPKEMTNFNLITVIKSNIIPIIFIGFSVFSLLLVIYVKQKFKGTTNPAFKIISIKNENYEVTTFLATYIVPLACINLIETKYFIMFIILVIVLGILITKMDLYLANPTLAFWGYKLYTIEVESNSFKGEFIVISMDKLAVNDKVEWIQLDNRRWFVRKENSHGNH